MMKMRQKLVSLALVICCLFTNIATAYTQTDEPVDTTNQVFLPLVTSSSDSEAVQNEEQSEENADGEVAQDEEQSEENAEVEAAAGTTPTYKFVNKLVDASDFGYSHSYGPAILYENGQFHMFYCSSGVNGGWDAVRYTTSADGRRWSAPIIVLKTSDLTNERAACDPSVVKFNAGDGNYYYLFYSGNKKDVQTVMFVARSATITGPYLKYTVRGTWQENAPDPKIIIAPIKSTPDAPDARNLYGAGQQTVVVKDGMLYSWFTDTTDLPPGKSYRIYFSTSKDGKVWSARVATNLFEATVDVKYDDAKRQFVMFLLSAGHDKNDYLARRYSSDGITWGAEQVLCNPDCFSDYAHNPGVSGDNQGHLIGDTALIIYGAPYDLNPAYTNDKSCTASPRPYCWGYWDLYGSVINPRGDVWNGIPWGWQWEGMSATSEAITGDFDGDGKEDLAIVNRTTSQWYIISSATGQQGVPGMYGIPWGWQWNGMSANHKIVNADYDGDGKTDRAIVDPAVGRWYIISSATGQLGVPGIPWGWQWGGMTSNHKIVIGDYDGDRKTDRAIVDPAISTWYIISSATGQLGVPGIPWGWQWGGMTSNHKIVIGDYDGDRKSDRAIVDSAISTWYIISSATGQLGMPSIPWGWRWAGMTANHKIVIADYDGDGKTDRAIMDPAISTWYIISSATGQLGLPYIPWGWQWQGFDANSSLVAADFNGDKAKELTAVNIQTGRWYVISPKGFKIY